jgi:prolyl-tRNA synthetase
MRILDEVYFPVLEDVLAIPVIRGRKTDRERFAGAAVTYTLEGLMRDGKALQLGTSHNMGENFAKAFDISYTDEAGAVRACHTTSWGMSTRVIGGLVMTHGDDKGLRLPPSVAPTQVVVLAVKEAALPAARELAGAAEKAGLRARVDDRVDQSFGRRAIDWELKGVPVRVEIGPRDLDSGQAVVARRDTDGKEPVAIADLPARLSEIVEDVRRSLRKQAGDLATRMTRDVSGASEIDGPGFFRIEWDALGREEGESSLVSRGYTVRCLVNADGRSPAPEDNDDLIAYVAKAY